MSCIAQASRLNRETIDRVTPDQVKHNRINIDTMTPQGATLHPPQPAVGGTCQDIFPAVLSRQSATNRDLALQVNIPFHLPPFYRDSCRTKRLWEVCRAETYLAWLRREMTLLAAHLDKSSNINRLVWKGAPASYFSLGQMSELFDSLHAYFGLSSLAARDYTIDIAPQDTSVLTLRHLQALGFNHLRLKVRDDAFQWSPGQFRSSPKILIETLMEEAWRLGFHRLDLAFYYATPDQTPQGLSEALEQVLDLSPRYLSLKKYPGASDNRFDAGMFRLGTPSKEMSGARASHVLYQLAHEKLLAAGYTRLNRQNYVLAPEAVVTDKDDLAPCINQDVLGLGLGALSRIAGQRIRTTDRLVEYISALKAGRLAFTECHDAMVVEP